jgi:hypothetical protein
MPWWDSTKGVCKDGKNDQCRLHYICVGKIVICVESTAALLIGSPVDDAR